MISSWSLLKHENAMPMCSVLLLFISSFGTSATNLIIVKKTYKFKTSCKDDCGWITQLKQQISKRCYYLAAYLRVFSVLKLVLHFRSVSVTWLKLSVTYFNHLQLLNILSVFFTDCQMPSVLWHCWLVVMKSIQRVKIEWWAVGVVICLGRGAGYLHMVQLMPLHPKPHRLLRHLNPDWFYLSGTGLCRLSWKRGR